MSSCVMKEAENKNIGSGKVRLLAINVTGIHPLCLSSHRLLAVHISEGKNRGRLVHSKRADRGCTYEIPGSTSPA